VPDQPDPRVQFRQGALDAIPYVLIGSRAVGVGDARRYMIADALWPLVERLLAEAYERGLREATEGNPLSPSVRALMDLRSRVTGFAQRLCAADGTEEAIRHGEELLRIVNSPWEPAEQPEVSA
jgi:hypothetical protein